MAEEQVRFTDGAAYERFMGRWSARVAKPFLEWLALPRGLRWIDVGCGNGAFTEQVVAHCGPSAVHGIDPSDGQLAYARHRNGVEHAQFRQGDAQALPFGNDEFDVAAMALVISFVPDQAQGVAEMRRVVRPGGCVATYMWDVAGGGLPIEPLRAAMRDLELPFPMLGNADLEHLDALWQQAGLESIETRVIRIPIEFANFEDWWDTHSASGGPAAAVISKLPAPDRERLRARVEETVPKAADGRITYSAHANAIKGRVPA